MWELHISEIDRPGRVAERFLSFARPRELVRERIDLRDVAARVVELGGADARRKSVDLSVELPDPPVMVLADRARWRSSRWTSW